MANGHGGARKGAGRPRKPLADKLLEGNPGKRKIKVLDIPGAQDEIPKPPYYLDKFNAIGLEEPDVAEIYNETAQWLQKTGCLHLVNPALIAEYAAVKVRWMQLEFVVSKLIIYKNEKKDIVVNPMYEAALKYLKAADAAWTRIWTIVAQNSENFYGDDPNNDVMLYLLSSKPER